LPPEQVKVPGKGLGAAQVLTTPFLLILVVLTNNSLPSSVTVPDVIGVA
jgi:hypothetical protein